MQGMTPSANRRAQMEQERRERESRELDERTRLKRDIAAAGHHRAAAQILRVGVCACAARIAGRRPGRRAFIEPITSKLSAGWHAAPRGPSHRVLFFILVAPNLT